MPTNLKQHLAIATGAVSAAAVPMGADAAIVYKDSSNAFSVSYAGPDSAEWDIDGAGGSDFRVFANPMNGGYINLFSGGRNGAGMVATANSFNQLNNLASGVPVGPILTGGYVWNNDDYNYRTLMRGSVAGGTTFYGLELGLRGAVLGSNFIGFRFDSGGNTLYGWAELILATTGGGTVTVNRWAYNDTPDGTIKVGQTVPAPGTLALLAAGAFGLRRWRAQRAAA